MQDGLDDAKKVIELLNGRVVFPQPREQLGAFLHRLFGDGLKVRPLSQPGHVPAQGLKAARALEVAAEEGLIQAMSRT